jgi:Ca2+-binding RTX toxin-like protein
VCLVLFAALLLPGSATAERLVAVAPGNQLVLFGPTTPSTTATHPITGLVGAGEVVLGIDSRPATGQVFLLSVDGASTTRTYTVNPDTGATSLIGQFSVPLLSSGDRYGYDFNPVADRIRVVNTSSQNLRINPNDGLAPGNTTDTPLSPSEPIIAAAYDHNTVGGGPTTLFDINGGTSRLVMQGSVGGSPNSPNTGLLSDVGPLGVVIDGATDGGFDIASSGVAYAAFTSAGVTRLYTVNLSTGAVTLVGTIGVGNLGVIEMTMAADAPPAQPAPNTVTATCQGKKATIVGTKRADKLTGTKGADVIAGLGGSDRVNGMKGNDRICGGNGKDDLKGGPGKDRINGDAGKDTLIGGGGGGDVCKGGAGHDTARNSCEKEPGVP